MIWKIIKLNINKPTVYINMEKIDILGKGISFPILLKDGAPIVNKKEELIRQSIVNILAWELGSFYFKGSFGASLNSFIERPLDEVTLALIRLRVVQAIFKFEKRVELISLTPFIRDLSQLQLSIKYRIITTNTVDSFIIPFINLVKY